MLENMKPPVRENIGCKVVRLAATLDKNDAELLMQYVADNDWIAESLTVALSERGLNIGPGAIRLHRKNQCICSRVNNA